MENIQIEIISLSILSLFVIFAINQFRYKISKKIGLIDYPDNIRKFHLKPVPLLGGIMIYSSFFLINLYLIYFQYFKITDVIILLGCTSCFLLGLVDDIHKISYKSKFIILIIIFVFIISFDKNLQISKIYFSTLNKEIYLGYFAIPFTVLCLLLLTNAMNLIDGIDGLCILISTILIAWIMNVFDNVKPTHIILIISLTYILYLNLKQNIFLGDNGSLFLGCLVSLNIIFYYNLETSRTFIPVENIFAILMLPGLDMLRVFGKRIINKKNPFSSDRSHLHYLLQDQNLSNKTILLIFLILILIPLLIIKYLKISQIIIISVYILFYFCLIFLLKKNIKN